MSNKKVKLVECPRDAMQGIKEFISTEKKIRYLNSLLEVGFDTLDFGSFVSPKAIPQMADTAEVLNSLDYFSTNTKLLAIVANFRGAIEACKYSGISYLGYPFSISETFQIRNANSTIVESFKTLTEIRELCKQTGKELVVYISMGFGNPYGDPYSEQLVLDWAGKLKATGARIISLADTVGVATPAQISTITKYLVQNLGGTEVGVHLHASPVRWKEKVLAAYDAGCRRFDGALKGFGGCPMANDELVGNIPTEQMVELLEEKTGQSLVDKTRLLASLEIASEVFNN